MPLRAKADRKARISVRGSRYSVPASLRPPHGGRPPRWLGAQRVRRGREVARHERSARRGAEILVLDHYLEVLSRKPGRCPARSRSRGLACYHAVGVGDLAARGVRTNLVPS